MAISRIGSADRVDRNAPSAQQEVTSRAREEKLAPGLAPQDVKDPRVVDVAKMYEKQFLREMVKAMRGSTEVSEFMKPSMPEKIYREQLDEQYVEKWGDNGGIGLQDLIYDQIMQRYFGGSPKDLAAMKAQGPIQLTDRDLTSVKQMPSQRPGQVPLKVEVGPATEGSGAVQIKAPWDGKVLTQTRLPDGKTAILVEHDKGLRSTLIFDGVAASGATAQNEVKKGATLGLLSPEIKSFFWNISSPAQAPAKHL